MRITLALFLACAGCTFLSIPAQASFPDPHHTYPTTYYSDATRTEVIGRYIVDRHGTVHEAGKRSEYSTYNSYICGPAAE